MPSCSISVYSRLHSTVYVHRLWTSIWYIYIYGIIPFFLCVLWQWQPGSQAPSLISLRVCAMSRVPGLDLLQYPWTILGHLLCRQRRCLGMLCVWAVVNECYFSVGREIIVRSVQRRVSFRVSLKNGYWQCTESLRGGGGDYVALIHGLTSTLHMYIQKHHNMPDCSGTFYISESESYYDSMNVFREMRLEDCTV